jgi:hypothetical protein
MNFSSLVHKFKLKFELLWNFEWQEFWINQVYCTSLQKWYYVLIWLLFLANVPAWWRWWLLCTNIASASEVLRSSANDSDSCYSTLACSTTSPPKCPRWCFWFPKYAGPIPNSPSCSRCPTRLYAECTVSSKTYYRYREGVKSKFCYYLNEYFDATKSAHVLFSIVISQLLKGDWSIELYAVKPG